MKHHNLLVSNQRVTKPSRASKGSLVKRLARSSVLRARVLLALSVASLLPSSGWTAVRSFELSQTTLLEEPGTALRSYARVLDERNEPVFHLEGMAINGTLGEEDLVLRDVRSFQASEEGVAYIFLVDISRSLSDREFGLIRGALANWTEGMRSRDRAAIVAFGNQSRLVVDFTSDIDRLTEGLDALGPTDNQTVFFEALQHGFELARRRDSDLPGRRVLIVLTDGRDEGSGWYLEDALAALREEPVPIYAIGLSRIRNAQERIQYLQLLKRLSTNSGGAFFEGSTANLTSTYSAIREAIHQVWVLDFVCPGCTRDGDAYRLQTNLSDGERILSDGSQIRLLPQSLANVSAAARSGSGSGTPGSPSGSDGTSADSASADSTIPSPRPDQEGKRSWLWFLLPLLAGVAAVWLLWSRRKPTPATASTTLETMPSPEPIEPIKVETFTTPTGVETTRPPRPPKLRMVRLVVVRGHKPGKQYSVTLLEQAVVGTRSDCDCVLIQEPGVSAEQFELLQVDGNVFIQDKGAPANPTLMDGLPLDGKQRIQSESLVGTRDFIVRVIFGEGRATARV